MIHHKQGVFLKQHTGKMDPTSQRGFDLFTDAMRMLEN